MARRRRDVWTALDDERSGDVFEALRHADAVVADRTTLRAMLECLGQAVDLATARAAAAGRQVTPSLTDWRDVARRLDEGPVVQLRHRLGKIERLYGDLDADGLHFAVRVSCLRARGWTPGDIARAVAEWNSGDDSDARRRALHNARRRVRACIKAQDANPLHREVLSRGLENHGLSDEERHHRLHHSLVEAMVRGGRRL